jgi:hypothetical protein
MTCLNVCMHPSPLKLIDDMVRRGTNSIDTASRGEHQAHQQLHGWNLDPWKKRVYCSTCLIFPLTIGKSPYLNLQLLRSSDFQP